MTLSKTPESSKRSSELLQSQQETRRGLPKFLPPKLKVQNAGGGTWRRERAVLEARGG